MTDKTDETPMTIGLTIGHLNPETKPIVNGLLSPNPGVKYPGGGLLDPNKKEVKDG